MGKRKKEELPDYTVANMDVDGMPWNSRRPWQIFPGDPSKSRKEFDVKVPEPGMENEVPDDLSAFQNPPMTKEERRGIIWLSLKASLTVGLIFGGAAFLFILFCILCKHFVIPVLLGYSSGSEPSLYFWMASAE